MQPHLHVRKYVLSPFPEGRVDSLERVERGVSNGLAVSGSLVALAVSVGVALLAPREDARELDPSGRFLAVTMSQPIRSLLPATPGHGGGRPGFLEIVGVDGRSYGRAPLPMVWMVHDLTWSREGAYIPAVAEWSFVGGGACRYWDSESGKAFACR
jgi:hypothetical protein